MDKGSVGEKIEKFRKAKKMTRQELASKSKLTYQAIFYIETGKRRPGELTVKAIAKGLGIPPALLFS